MTAEYVIARAFCEHRGQGTAITLNGGAPCNRCIHRARAAVAELAGQQSLLVVPTEPAPLSNPDASTPGKARRNGSAESVAARWAVMPKTGTQRRRILDAFRLRPTWTDDELIVALGMSHQSVGPRRGELVGGGWLTDSGERRLTRAGLMATVWRLTPQARQRWGGV